MLAKTLLRMTAAASALLIGLGSIVPARAVPPPIVGVASPPGRVGRLARIGGSVAFHAAEETSWSPAVLNTPLTGGNALWTEPATTAEIEVGGNRLALDGATELDIATLDDHALVASTPQGEVYLSLRIVPPGDSYTIQTPRGTVQIAAAGRYEVAAGDTDHPTVVTVVEGTARVVGPALALLVEAGQMASLAGTDSVQGAVGPMRPDAFLTAMLARERPAAAVAAVPQAVAPVVTQMTGYADLEQYGAWSETPQTGAVWYPRVESGWAPYRHGRWSYVAPWGWTWVDEAPWGFAPFHYGRWIRTEDRWGWVPVDPGLRAYPRPVYAPALVGWLDLGAAAAIGAAAGGLLASRPVGWVPLGPNEPYYPPYSRSLAYVRTMNATSVRNVETVITANTVTIGSNNRTVVNNFVNRGGATVVPAAALAQSAPIAAAMHPLAPQELGSARGQVAPPVRPTAATLGVTPAVGRQFAFTPGPRPGAAGPSIGPSLFRPAGGLLPRAVLPPAGRPLPELARPGVLPGLRAAAPGGVPGAAAAGGIPGLSPAIGTPPAAPPGPARVRPPGPAPVLARPQTAPGSEFVRPEPRGAIVPRPGPIAAGPRPEPRAVGPRPDPRVAYGPRPAPPAPVRQAPAAPPRAAAPPPQHAAAGPHPAGREEHRGPGLPR